MAKPRIKIKNSNALDNGAPKAPQVGDLDYGELALNYNEQGPTLFIKDRADNIVALADAGRAASSAVQSVSVNAPLTDADTSGTAPNLSISPATTTSAGSLSAADKTTIDGLDELAFEADATDGPSNGTRQYARQVETTNSGSSNAESGSVAGSEEERRGAGRPRADHRPSFHQGHERPGRFS